MQWVFGKRRIPLAVHLILLVIAAAAVVGVVLLLDQPELMEYMLPTRMWLDANHFLVAVGVMLVGLIALLWELRQWLPTLGEPPFGSGNADGLGPGKLDWPRRSRPASSCS